jgi:ribosomal protein S18 acetylase RimI-like enzyme
MSNSEIQPQSPLIAEEALVQYQNQNNLQSNGSIVQLLAARGLYLELETPKSVTKLYSSNYLPEQRFCSNSHVGKDIEIMIRDAYIDELYDDAMHCVTVRNSSTGEALGIVFWRDLSQEEMKKHMKVEFVEAAIKEQQALPQAQQKQNQIIYLNDKSEANELANQLEELKIDEERHVESAKHSGSELAPVNQMNAANINRGWIKIELLATLPCATGQRIGTILLSAALVYAARHRKNKGLLHVAGGNANIPAIQLYQKFGFHSVPPEYFNQPNKEMFVLLDINRILRRLDWTQIIRGKTKFKTKLVSHNSEASKSNENSDISMDLSRSAAGSSIP